MDEVADDLDIVDPPLRCLFNILLGISTLVETMALNEKARAICFGCIQCFSRCIDEIGFEEADRLFKDAVKSFESRLPPKSRAIEKIFRQMKRLNSAVISGNPDRMIRAAEKMRQLIDEAIMLAKVAQEETK